MSDSLDKWRIFQKLSVELKWNIRLAVVFRGSAIYVTKDDEVFGFGDNLKGFLGTGDEEPRKEHTKIEQLCGQNIQGLQFSDRTFFAVSACGSVFAWGDGKYGQLGLGTKRYTLIPTKIEGTLSKKRVVQIACSSAHTLALTSDRKVFSFGRNNDGQLGLGHKKTQTLPIEVDFPSAGKNVTAIACLAYSSIALLDSGEVLAWGNNSFCNSDPSTDDLPQQKKPSQVPGLEGITITGIVCGLDHALALSNDGNVYSWGWNDCGQLGNGTTEISLQPTLVSRIVGSIRNVAAHYDCDFNAAVTEADEVYIWGDFNGQIILRPTETSFTSLDEVFAKLPIPVMTFRPLRPKLAEPIIEEKNTANESPEWLRKSFDDFETADVVFVVEGKKIHAHKAILIMRCDVFRTIFQGDWTESNESEQIIEHQSYGAFYAFLKYFYTDDIDLPPDSALELLDLAHFYHLPVLQEKCGQLVKRGVTVENAAAILEKAIYYESKDLEEYVFQFCLDHMTGVISSDGFKKLDKDTVSEFLKRAAQYGAFKN